MAKKKATVRSGGNGDQKITYMQYPPAHPCSQGDNANKFCTNRGQ